MEQCTVVIPCRNRHDRIADAVASAVTIPFVAEVIVVDDGSSPPITAELFAAVSEARKVRIASNRLTGGAQGARVTGAMEAATDIVVFLDSDDTLCGPGLNELHQRLIASGDLAMVYGNVRRRSRVTNVLRLEGDAFRPVLTNLSLCPFSGLIVRKPAVPWEALDLTLPAWQDDDFVLTVCKRGKVAFVDAVVAEMQITADAISASSVRQLLGLIALVEKWKPDILRELGASRLFLWRLRQLALLCLAISDDWRAPAARPGKRSLAASFISFAFRMFARAIRAAIRPFFDRLYV